MNFDKNMTRFPTMVHRDIYMAALQMTPPDISLSGIEKIDAELAQSGRAFYAFMIDLLGDMYHDPRLYGMHPGAYEEYTNGVKYNAVKRKQPAAARGFYDQSAAGLSSYLDFIKSMASLCRIAAHQCVLSAEDFEHIKSYDYLPGRQREKAVPIKTVIDMFAQKGLAFHKNADGSMMVTNDKYPHMLTAMSALAKAVDESIQKPVSNSLKYYFAHNWRLLEFRQILQNYRPVYEDFARFLPDGGQAIMLALHQMAKAYQLRETYGRPFTIEYRYKGKRVMSIWAHDSWIEPNKKQKQWVRTLSVRIWGSSRLEYQQKVAQHGEDFVKYFRRHLNYCNCCNPDHVAGKERIRQVLGKNVRICSDPGGIIKKPTIEDLPYIQTYIYLQVEEILAGA